MESHRVKKTFLPPGQLLGLILIGLMLLSGLVYYKAVKAQRYLEPTLAIAQPRITFANNISSMIEDKFGIKKVKGLSFATDAIFLDDALLFTDPVQKRKPDLAVLKKLGQVFLTMLEHPETRFQFNLILVGARMPIGPHAGMNVRQRREMQRVSELILYSLFKVEPELERKFGIYFAATVIPVLPHKKTNWVEFRILPSEHLHVEMIKSLEKYF
jgi:hypothetical protein